MPFPANPLIPPLFALCAQADALAESGRGGKARQLLEEAAALEPAAGFIRDRI